MFDVKTEDLQRKARLVVGGYQLDSSHFKIYSSVVQAISVRILLTIGAKNKLKVSTCCSRARIWRERKMPSGDSA